MDVFSLIATKHYLVNLLTLPTISSKLSNLYLELCFISQINISTKNNIKPLFKLNTKMSYETNIYFKDHM